MGASGPSGRSQGDRRSACRARRAGGTAARISSWEPLRIELVVEVSFDHLQGTRFRHGAHFKRWRPDKPGRECRYDQLEETPAFELAKIFGGEG